MPVANAQDCVFAPAIGARPGMVVGKEFPGCAVWAVVFADRAPLTFGKVWSPSLPVDFASPRFFKPVLLSVRNPGVSSTRDTAYRRTCPYLAAAYSSLSCIAPSHARTKGL